MIKVTVLAGNGGDYEWVRDVHYWQRFIEQKIPQCNGKKDFVIYSHDSAFHAVVEFRNPHHATIFSLIKPEYINYSDVEDNQPN